jgi:hypothetical protein
LLAQLHVAFADLRLRDPVKLYLLAEHEQQLLAPVSIQAQGDIPCRGF